MGKGQRSYAIFGESIDIDEYAATANVFATAAVYTSHHHYQESTNPASHHTANKCENDPELWERSDVGTGEDSGGNVQDGLTSNGKWKTR